jgi:excisionase family DNA binding protein
MSGSRLAWEPFEPPSAWTTSRSEHPGLSDLPGGAPVGTEQSAGCHGRAHRVTTGRSAHQLGVALGLTASPSYSGARSIVAAGLLGISRGLAYELVNRGELPALRLGRRLVVPISALENLVAGAGKAGPTTAPTTNGQTQQTAGNGSGSAGRGRSTRRTVEEDSRRLPHDGLESRGD